jgi:NADH-quinone oxidoreductase subunit N
MIGCFNCFAVTKFIILAKIFVLSVFGVFVLIHFFVKDAACPYFEFTLLTLLSVLGGFFLLMIYDLIGLYLSLELQSLVLYVLPIVLCISGNFPREASFKYFVFGSIASSLILLGISFIYGFCGFTRFNDLIEFFNFDSIFETEFRFLVGVLFVFLGVLFKIGIVPFHY